MRRPLRPSVGRYVAALLLVAAPLRAHHDASSNVVPTLDPLDDRLAGVTVQLQHTLANQLIVENRTGRVLEVLDDSGLPFLRLGPAGAEANLAADAWYRTASAGDVALPDRSFSAEPRWVRIADGPAWGWYDRRLRAAPTPANETAVADRWTVPLRLGGTPLALSGRFRVLRRPAGRLASRVTSPAEPLPGVRASLVAGRVPALYLENGGARPVVVVGSAGEPFLRIGPDGTSANLRSPTWLASGKAEVTQAALRADAGAAPVWVRVSTTSRFAWIEFRAAYPEDAPPLATDEPGVVRRWSVPLERGRERTAISGVVEWLPVTNGTP